MRSFTFRGDSGEGGDGWGGGGKVDGFPPQPAKRRSRKPAMHGVRELKNRGGPGMKTGLDARETVESKSPAS